MLAHHVYYLMRFIDAQIAAKSLEADAAKFELRSTFDERGYRLAEMARSKSTEPYSPKLTKDCLF